jgi:Domain of unknown function (DUF4145)
MDGYQFAASLFSSLTSLAWPAALVACVWLFREKLNTLLPLLRMKYKDFDVSFRLDQAEKEAAQIPPPPPSPDLEPTPEEKSRYEKVAEHSPRAAILEKRAELEQALRSIAEPYLTAASTKSWKNMSLTSAIRVLRQHNIIDEKTSALFDDLRTIGNRAAHSEDGNEFTTEEALRFRKLTDDAIALTRLLS